MQDGSAECLPISNNQRKNKQIERAHQDGRRRRFDVLPKKEVTKLRAEKEKGLNPGREFMQKQKERSWRHLVEAGLISKSSWIKLKTSEKNRPKTWSFAGF